MDRLLRQKEVLTAVGLSRMAVYKLRKAGSFPAPVTLGKPESTEGGPWGQPLKKPEGAPLNLG